MRTHPRPDDPTTGDRGAKPAVRSGVRLATSLLGALVVVSSVAGTAAANDIFFPIPDPDQPVFDPPGDGTVPFGEEVPTPDWVLPGTLPNNSPFWTGQLSCSATSVRVGFSDIDDHDASLAVTARLRMSDNTTHERLLSLVSTGTGFEWQGDVTGHGRIFDGWIFAEDVHGGSTSVYVDVC